MENNINVSAIRELCLDTFTRDTLERFCQDRETFRRVRNDFLSNTNLNKMVDALIEYCDRNVLFNDLLKEIKKLNPNQYIRYETKLLQNAIEKDNLSVDDLYSIYNAAQNVIKEIEQNKIPILSDSELKSELDKLPKGILDDPKLTVKNKLKFVFPIIPAFLSYEIELEINNGLNLKNIWNKMIEKLKNAVSDCV